MVFSDFLFLPFMVSVFVVHWALQGMRARKLWLLVASYVFYGCWNWTFLFLILFSTVLDYFVGLRMHAAERPRAWLVLSLLSNLGLLAYFKYCNFFIASAAALLAELGLGTNFQTLSIILPVGISFYTFQTLSYSIDVYRRRLEPTRDFLDFALFVGFFPQLVAGPIMRAVAFLPQLKQPVVFARTDVRAALVLFFMGFVKKACVADSLATYVDFYFDNPGAYDSLSAWCAVLFYSVQIYCDFSGYSDMAIACAALLGYRLCINFNHPYFAPNISAFWQRWHISLSSWLRDYLYIPLGGSQGSKLLTARNLLLTMLLGGLWHGAGWNFVIWGGLHGLALMLHRAWSQKLPADSGARRMLGLLGIPLTFLFVSTCWIFFRASSLGEAVVVTRAFVLFQEPSLAGQVSASLVGDLSGKMFLFLGFLLALHGYTYWRRPTPIWQRMPWWAFSALAALTCALVLPWVQMNAKPFIYFQF